MIRKFFGTLLFVILWLPFFLLGLIFVPVSLALSKRTTEHLPRVFWFWDTPHGINGDSAWIADCNPDVFMAPDPEAACAHITKWKSGNERKFGKRLKWLIWENPNSNLKHLLK